MSLRQVTIGVIGSGTATDELVCDVLCEHFAYGPVDADGYFAKSTEFEVHVLIPVGRDLLTQGIEAVWQWAMRCELPYLALTDGSSTDKTEMIREGVEDEADWQMTVDPLSAVVGLLEKAAHPMLLVVTEDSRMDEDTTVHVVKAMACGVPVYDLSRALLEITWADLGMEAPAIEEKHVVEESGGQLAVAVAEPEYTLSADEMGAVTTALAQAYQLADDLATLAKDSAHLKPVLAAAERALKPLTAAVNGTGAGERPPLAVAPAPQEDQPEPEPGTRTRMEVFDEATQTWRPAGRGRPKQGVKTRRVPR